MTASRMRGERGQSLVEFSVALTVFVMLLMGIVDFGMGVYKYNGVSQAAREIARVASVHQGSAFSSSEITAVESTQSHLIPGLSVSSITCTDINGASVGLVNNACPNTAFVTVTVTSIYKASTPILGLVGIWTMSGTSSAQIQQ
jgi:Flp pilus assembly protein TadG